MIKPQSHRKSPARVIIADDYELIRAGLRNMLEGNLNLKVVGEATNGRQAVTLCKALQAHLALLDVRMPEMDGLAAARAIRQASPQTRVLILTTNEDPDYRLAALKAGAAAYVLKDVTRHDLLNTIQKVLRGEAVLSGEIATRPLLQMGSQPARTSLAQLTPREYDVLAYMVTGQTNTQIAQALAISIGTVKGHVQHIIAKLGVLDRTQAAVRAIETGLLRSAGAEDEGGMILPLSRPCSPS